MYRTILLLVLAVSIIIPCFALGQEISVPEVKVQDDTIFVSFSLNLDGKTVEEISQGIDKEFRFYVDLFRVWKSWPDEFVGGRLFIKKLRVDPIKKEYTASSNDGSVIREKRFRSLDSMLNWVLTMENVKVVSLKDLQPGDYFLKLTAESKLRKVPPLLGPFIIFISESDFKVIRNSGIITVTEPK